MSSMLDTNICIAIMKGNPRARTKLSQLSPDMVCISSIVLAELSYGVQKGLHQEQNKQALADFLTICPVLDWPGEAAEAYGQIRANLESQGRTIGANDLLIAAHAVHWNTVLVTHNINEFSKVPGLIIEDWLT